MNTPASSNLLEAGTLVAGRFEIESIAGRGGMGTVYRACDRQQDRRVALKLMEGAGTTDVSVERFGREATLLSELRHPNIVGYVAHGRMPDGQPYLAMEWLEGFDLSERLTQGTLSLAESLALLEHVASALSVAHRCGIIHRDIKPNNLFLRGGLVEQVAVLDFGIARREIAGARLTRTGVVIGTPEYMAPEQVRGDRDAGAATDIFALGTTIYECITGQSPFKGEHVVAALAAVLLQDPVPIETVRPDVPPGLATLIGRMLAKNPADRPADASALREAVAALGPLEFAEVSPSPRSSRSSRRRIADETEQQLFSVVLAAPNLAALGGAATAADGTAGDRAAEKQALRVALLGLGAQAEWVVDGSLIVTITRSRSATDLVALAARCALLVQERWPDASIAIATGRGAIHADLPVGEVVTRASGLLSRFESGEHRMWQGIVIDELSAQLLDSRFVIARSGDRITVQSERVTADHARLLLGKATPCVGREQELAMLDALLVGCVEESMAKVALVTAIPGMGKSRLRHEFLRRVAARDPAPSIFVAFGDQMSAGSPYGIAGRLARRICCVADGSDTAAGRACIVEHVATRVPEADRQRVSEFLGEICHVPFPGEGSVPLRTARSDPRVMSEQIVAAFVDLLRGECANAPTVLVLEDLHWGDSPSIKLLETVVRELSDHPLLVVGLARPELHDIFPKLWSGSGRHEISLQNLSRKASERLVRQVLGAKVVAATVDHVVSQAGGNALFLEELIRAAAEGKEESPPTILAMLQARLSCFDAESRRIVRAASVFGLHFWQGGLAALLGAGSTREDLEHCLERLCREEIVEKRRESRFAGETEYGFRHALMREAAYELLGDANRTAWHGEAAHYLEQVGERNPSVLAEHYQRGDQWEKASRWYVLAAEESLASFDLEGVLARVDRGLDCAAEDEIRGQLLQVRSTALMWLFRWDETNATAREALRLLPSGSQRWFRAYWALMGIAGLVADDETFVGEVNRFWSVEPSEEAQNIYIETICSIMFGFVIRGLREPARICRERIQDAASRCAEDDFQSRGWISTAESEYLRVFDPSPWNQSTAAADAERFFRAAGNDQWALISSVLHAQALCELGYLEEGLAALRALLSGAGSRTPRYVIANATFHLAALLVRTFDLQRMKEAQGLLEVMVASEGITRGYRLWAHALMAEIAMVAGDLETAESEARAATAPNSVARLRRIRAVAVLIEVLVRREKYAEARELAREQLAALQELGSIGYVEVPVRLAIASASGADEEEARERIREVMMLLGERSRKIPTAEDRRRYLSGWPENAEAIRRAVKMGLPVEDLLGVDGVVSTEE